MSYCLEVVPWNCCLIRKWFYLICHADYHIADSKLYSHYFSNCGAKIRKFRQIAVWRHSVQQGNVKFVKSSNRVMAGWLSCLETATFSLSLLIACSFFFRRGINKRHSAVSSNVISNYYGFIHNVKHTWLWYETYFIDGMQSDLYIW